jgi:hypothetical protein
VTPKPFWLAVLAAALPFAAAGAGRAAEADRPSLPKCLAHAKGLCLWHHPACLALDAASRFWSEPQYTVAAPPPCCPNACYSAPGCATPACACVPAGASMPCWSAGTCWSAGVLPPPAPVAAPTPCPCPPLPHPTAGPFPAAAPPAPPMTVWAEPVPFYAPCGTMPAAAPAHYVVETKLVRSGGPGGAIDTMVTRCAVSDGAPAEVAVRGPLWGNSGQTVGALGVCVVPAGKHKVGVEVGLECGHAEKCGKDGERMQCDCARAVRTVKLGQPTRFVLRKGAAGAEETSAEVTVTEMPNARPERLAKAPRPASPTCPVAAAVTNVVTAVGELCGGRAASAGMRLPSGQYVQHPPQYFPPSPAFPLTRELATQEAVWSAPPAAMVVPPMPVPALAVPMAAPPMPAAEGPALKCKSIALQVAHDEEVHVRAGKGRVQVCGSGLEVSADRVETTMGGRVLMLQGHVRLTCHNYGSEMHVEADRVKLTLKREHAPAKATSDAE